MLEPRLSYLADPGAGQHAEAGDIRRAAVRGRLQRSRQVPDLLLRQKPIAWVLDPAPKAGRRVIRAPTPSLRMGEHFSEHLANAVGSDGYWFWSLQLAGALARLGRERPGAVFGDAVEQLFHIIGCDLGYQTVLIVRPNQLAQH